MDKAARRIRTFSMGFLISGILSILIGAYYLFVKAGLPYQVPPLTLWTQSTAGLCDRVPVTYRDTGARHRFLLAISRDVHRCHPTIRGISK